MVNVFSKANILVNILVKWQNQSAKLYERQISLEIFYGEFFKAITAVVITRFFEL